MITVAEYNRMHQQLRRKRGPANTHDCVGCGRLAEQWSYTHDSDPFSLDSYSPRCTQCHKAYDKDFPGLLEPVGKRQTIKRSTNPRLNIPAEVRVEIRERYRNEAVSQRALAREYGISQMAVSLIVRET